MRKLLRIMSIVTVVAILSIVFITFAHAAAKEIGKDGRFIAYDNGTVLDTKTKLIWAAKDNGTDINWVDAKAYCESYKAGGYADWRIPTKEELAGLFDKSKSYESEKGGTVYLTKLIHLTARLTWTSTEAAFNFYFGKPFVTGNAFKRNEASWSGWRVLPVRLAK